MSGPFVTSFADSRPGEPGSSMMTLSIYTFVKDALYFDYHLVDMLRHHLSLADEIVVCEGYSQDRTYEAVAALGEPKIRLFRERIPTSDPKKWLRTGKDLARRRCTGDWCLLLDCDEFVPEWEFDRLRNLIETTEAQIIAGAYTHFFGNYKVFYDNPSRPFPPRHKHILHRNLPTMEILGDGSDVRLPELGDAAVEQHATIPVHHFGEVRKASRLRHKLRIQANRDISGRWDWMPAFLFDLFPFNWKDPDFLPHLKTYEGPYVRAVRENPGEFIRDRFRLYDALSQRGEVTSRS